MYITKIETDYYEDGTPSPYVKVKCRFYASTFCFDRCKKRSVGCAGEPYRKGEGRIMKCEWCKKESALYYHATLRLQLCEGCLKDVIRLRDG